MRHSSSALFCLVAATLELFDEEARVRLPVSITAMVVMTPTVLVRAQLGARFVGHALAMHRHRHDRLSNRKTFAIRVQEHVGNRDVLTRLHAVQFLHQQLVAGLYPILLTSCSNDCVHWDSLSKAR